MTAKEMFEDMKLVVLDKGIELVIYDYDWTITFDKYKKLVLINDEIVGGFNAKMIIAIHQQMKELGWIE